MSLFGKIVRAGRRSINPGCVYVATTAKLRKLGYCKIGFSDNDAASRMRSLKGSVYGGMWGKDWRCDGEFAIRFPKYVESHLHLELIQHQLGSGGGEREIFKIPFKKANRIVLAACDNPKEAVKTGLLLEFFG